MKFSIEPQPNLSASSDHRTNLLQQIQQGSKLRKVDPPSSDKTPVPTNPPNLRDNMMSEIKQGTTLKRVIFLD